MDRKIVDKKLSFSPFGQETGKQAGGETESLERNETSEQGRRIPSRIGSESCQGSENPWEGAEIKRVSLNQSVVLSYIDKQSIDQVLDRYTQIHTKWQKDFQNVISSLRKESNRERVRMSNDVSEGFHHTIAFLNFTKYLWSFLYPPFRKFLCSAEILYPVSPLLRWAFRRLLPKRDRAEAKSYRFMSEFDFAVELLFALDENRGSVFLLGGSSRMLVKMEQMFSVSFPNLNVIGRYSSHHRKGKAIKEILTVINKSQPTLLLISQKTGLKDLACLRANNKMKVLMTMYYPHAVKAFSGRSKRKRRKFLSAFFQGFLYLCFPLYWIKVFFSAVFVLIVSLASLRQKGQVQ